MSVLEPEDADEPIDAEIVEDSEEEPDPDADVLAGLEAQFGDVEEPNVEDVTQLTPKALLKRHSAVQRELEIMDELFVPRTQEGRDLHSRLIAYLIEMRKRGMM